jgi:hypothetical protein
MGIDMHNDSKRFGRHFEGTDKPSERATDYSKDPKFNKQAAVKAELDFYAKMDKVKGIDNALEHGNNARKVRGH